MVSSRNLLAARISLGVGFFYYTAASRVSLSCRIWHPRRTRLRGVPGLMADRHSKKYYEKHHPDWDFIAVDGEGSTSETPILIFNENKKEWEKYFPSIYQLLAANVKGKIRSIERKEGLSTVECLEFLLGLRYRKQKLAVVGYGFTYDICNIVKDLHWKKLTGLAKDEVIGLYIDGNHRYKIRVIYKKSLEIWEMKRVGKKWKQQRYVRVYDAIGFFQTSFLRAIEEYGIGTPEQLALIESYKSRRGENLEADFEGWKEYNATECLLLTALMKDFAGLLKAENIKVSHWWGAGAIASAWYKEHNIKDYLVQSFGEPIDTMIGQAYFGGQVQRLKIGIWNQPIYHYDICSAYPWAISEMPDLHGEWRETDHFEPGEKWALYDIDWDLRGSVWDSCPYGPLPHRCKNNSNVYPMTGNGVFWYWEVAAVLRRWPQCVKVIKGQIF